MLLPHCYTYFGNTWQRATGQVPCSGDAISPRWPNHHQHIQKPDIIFLETFQQSSPCSPTQSYGYYGIAWKRLLWDTRDVLFLCCFSSNLWLPVSSDSARQGERQWVITLTVQLLTHHERCGSVQTASPPVGVRLQNPSLASLLLHRAHSWQQETQEVKKKGCWQSDTPHITKGCSTMIPCPPPPLSQCPSLGAVTLHWSTLHQVCQCRCWVCVCQQISTTVSLRSKELCTLLCSGRHSNQTPSNRLVHSHSALHSLNPVRTEWAAAT